MKKGNCAGFLYFIGFDEVLDAYDDFFFFLFPRDVWFMLLRLFIGPSFSFQIHVILPYRMQESMILHYFIHLNLGFSVLFKCLTFNFKENSKWSTWHGVIFMFISLLTFTSTGGS